ncbi:hypothetical protein V499_01110 [Pseudogymnoascus sp. VKM F-103]|nr:hypothetical protein V499_01110 [Pseudogymnoascus sp. VKM F-103]
MMYYNREQLSHTKSDQICTILRNPTAFKPIDRESKNLKHRALFDFKLIDNKLYRQSDIRHPNSRYVVPKAEVFDVIAQEHLKLLHAGRNKVLPTIEQQYYGIKREDVEFILKKYCFALFIAAFLPLKIMQADNGKEFKGALLILLRKYGIQVVNGASRSPQTQGLVEQANGVVEAKLRAWKMDHGSTEWKDGLLEVTLAMNTQIHSTIGLNSELSSSGLNSEPSSGPELRLEIELNSELNSELCRRAPTRAQARALAQL